MGQKIELNTMLRLGKESFSLDNLKVGEKHTISKPNIRLYPTDLPLLLLAENWKILGYCAIRKTVIFDGKMELEFEILSLFMEESRKIYTTDVLQALKLVGYDVESS